MKKVLLDINVILDVVLDRKGHYESSAALWDAVKAGTAEGLLSAHAVTTIHCLIARERGQAAATQTIESLVAVFRVAAVDRTVIDEAFRLPFSDFEDAVTAAAAHAAKCDFIATRDPKGFRNSPVRPMLPEAIVPLLVV